MRFDQSLADKLDATMSERPLPEDAVTSRATVSRADVVTAVRAASRTESWAEAFVASQVWGYGLTGYGPIRTHRVLARPRAEAVIGEAVSLLLTHGALAAYERLSTLHGLGPAFSTKFLHFADLALPGVPCPAR
ncbi:hypothetical protein ACIG0D_19815 [Streptomyces sp. NPDC052773]|uniref:8-oxoguanine DNA glycosylase OGG fold protein n=1 Tax=Streptomyces sp. NPDC052773 TaxID=3365693 RepID=UPI0037D0D7D3